MKPEPMMIVVSNHIFYSTTSNPLAIASSSITQQQMTLMEEPLIMSDNNPAKGPVHTNSNDHTVFSCAPKYSTFLKYDLVLFVAFAETQRWIYVSCLSTDNRQAYFEETFWSHTVRIYAWLLVIMVLFTPSLMRKTPTRISLTSQGSLVLKRRWFPPKVFEGVESAQRSSQVCWWRRIGGRKVSTEGYATSIGHRVMVKLASGTQVLISPANVDVFLDAVDKLIEVCNQREWQGDLYLSNDTVTAP